MTARRIKGDWWCDFRYQRKRIRKKSPVDNKRGAEEYERQLRTRLLEGLPLDGQEEENRQAPVFEEYIAEWLMTYAVTNSKPSELKSKRSIVHCHLLPFFGRRRIDLIGIRDIERFKARQVRRKLSAKSINNHLTVLRRSLACAVEWELIASVPLVKWMKVPKPEFDFLTRAESERLLAAAPLEDHAIICTALKTGLRIGELLGLRWEDVDLVAGKVLVRRSAWRRNVTTPKSGKSREVPISPELHGVLSGHRHLRGPLVFCHENGSMLSRDQVKRVLPRACRLAGLRRVQWHVLRHSFASQLVMAGVPLKVVQELLGHSTIEMTMRYAHVAPDAKIDAVSVLDGPARGAQSGHHLGISRMG